MHFSFWGVSEFPIFREMFLIGGQISKNNGIPKQKKQRNNKKIRCKTKENLILIQNKARQQAEKTQTKEHLETKRKQNKNKKQEPETEMRNRD